MHYFQNFPFIKQDKNAKSLSFFCTNPISRFDEEILKELIKIGKCKNENCRISLHSAPESTLHNMIILHHKNTYNRPHYHKTKAETYHLIEGSQTVFIFDQNGRVIDRCAMSLGGVFMYRFEAGYFHMSIPTSDHVIFHETKIGPFVREGDSIYADWAPSTIETEASNAFIANLLQNPI